VHMKRQLVKPLSCHISFPKRFKLYEAFPEAFPCYFLEIDQDIFNLILSEFNTLLDLYMFKSTNRHFLKLFSPSFSTKEIWFNILVAEYFKPLLDMKLFTRHYFPPDALFQIPALEKLESILSKFNGDYSSFQFSSSHSYDEIYSDFFKCFEKCFFTGGDPALDMKVVVVDYDGIFLLFFTIKKLIRYSLSCVKNNHNHIKSTCSCCFTTTCILFDDYCLKCISNGCHFEHHEFPAIHHCHLCPKHRRGYVECFLKHRLCTSCNRFYCKYCIQQDFTWTTLQDFDTCANCLLEQLD